MMMVDYTPENLKKISGIIKRNLTYDLLPKNGLSGMPQIQCLGIATMLQDVCIRFLAMNLCICTVLWMMKAFIIGGV